MKANLFSKYHVMDSTLRPKATANRMKSKLHSAVSRKALSKSASTGKKLATSSPKPSTERSVPSEPESEGSDIPIAPA